MPFMSRLSTTLSLSCRLRNSGIGILKVFSHAHRKQQSIILKNMCWVLGRKMKDGMARVLKLAASKHFGFVRRRSIQSLLFSNIEDFLGKPRMSYDSEITSKMVMVMLGN
jgi:hypothetical protein